MGKWLLQFGRVPLCDYTIDHARVVALKTSAKANYQAWVAQKAFRELLKEM